MSDNEFRRRYQGEWVKPTSPLEDIYDIATKYAKTCPLCYAYVRAIMTGGRMDELLPQLFEAVLQDRERMKKDIERYHLLNGSMILKL